jgi:penicillin-insensitive murein endopeptidase
VVATSGCAAPFALDDSSASVGWHAGGTVRRPALLPAEGDGYTVPAPWRERQSGFGTDELVEGIVRAARAVARAHPGAMVAVGDLSRQSGGASPEHRSHQNGRDLDIFYYAESASGAAVTPGSVMIRFDGEGRAVRWSPARGHPAPRLPVPPYRFDARRNWALVRALLSDADIEVQWLFVERSLAARMLRQGAVEGDDPELLARAAAIMKQPTDAEPHDDHMHLRVFCDPADRAQGCADRGPARWWKKRWKYMAPPFARDGRASGEVDAASALLGLLRTRVPVQGGRPRLSS